MTLSPSGIDTALATIRIREGILIRPRCLSLRLWLSRILRGLGAGSGRRRTTTLLLTTDEAVGIRGRFDEWCRDAGSWMLCELHVWRISGGSLLFWVKIKTLA
jgi:hypothetical protein